MEKTTEALSLLMSTETAETTAQATATSSVSSFFSSLWSTIAEYAAKFGIRLIGAIIILIVGVKLIKLIVRGVEKGKGYQKMPKTAQVLLKDIVKILLYLLLIVIIATTLGVSMTSLVAVIASAGLAVGLALQGSLANLAGGFIILIFRPFEVGDYISDGTNSGTVTDIGVFYTTMLTIDNKRITIPNGSLSNTAVTDYSAKETRRVDLNFSVAYDSDIDLVRGSLMGIMENHELILKDPAPFVCISEHGNSAIVFTTRAWVKTDDYWTVYYDMLEASKKLFDKRGIEIPYPQMDVHLKNK